ncbi:lysozyme inhibitor LprI family protein [Enterobacter mori]|uniref:lysozyme inhibitor LprI family protein n=1 Tax=Enterobacter mori TaxID=539813 RepID=UPI00241EBF22|nr:lysozyme inhibitor LprI family protein [Enterobacter mori]MEB7566853.1 DUF1311 domain-containing protein [Enterobacter mori]
MKFFILIILTSFSAFSFENCISENVKILVRCTLDNYKKEDAYLNYLYNTIITTYPELKEDMKNTQRSWVKARDSICTYTSVDGEELQVYKNSCLYEQTYERNRELKTILSKQEVVMSHENSTSNSFWDEYVKQHCTFMKDKFSDNDCMKRNEFLHYYE